MHKIVAMKPVRRGLLMRENMRTQNTQQYHAFIQKFFSLFDEIKEEDDPIYNTRIGFNAVRFLIENPNWNLDKNEARKAIFQKYNGIKKPNQKLQEEAKGVLNEYIDEDGVKEVLIYDNHANIALKDNKKEFKISEFLNSDFCQKNGISGFSTLHSDGKSGMHGFIVEEGKEKRKVRHYVVTDGSYEMTLNWYDKDEKKCTIKIKIDKEGVDLIERNGVTEEQLKANKDVKIGGLFLHQIQFKEKGREQENKQSSETFIGSNSKNVGVQAYREPQSNSSYDSGIEEDLDNAQGKHKLRQAARKENLDAKVHNFQLPFKENLQNKRTPPPLPLRIISLLPEANEQTSVNQSGGQRDKQNNSALNNQQKGEHQLISDPSNSSTFVSQNQNDREEDKQSTFTTFGYTTSGRKKTVTEEALQVKSAALVLPTQDVTLKRVEGTFKSKDAKGSDNTGDKQPLNDVASILAWRAKIKLLRSESEYDEEFSDLEDSGSDNEDEYPTLSNPQLDYEQEKSCLSIKENEEIGNDEQKEIRDKLQENGSLEDSLTDIKTNDSGYSSPTYTSHYNFRVNSEKLKKSLENIEPKKEDTSELLEKLDKELKGPAQQATKAKNSFSENILEKVKEGKQYDPIRKWLEKKVAEQENADTNPTIDKNSELYKLLEKDATQLKDGIIEEEKETEHIGSPRVALANKNRKLLWTKRIAEQQEKDDGINIG